MLAEKREFAPGEKGSERRNVENFHPAFTNDTPAIRSPYIASTSVKARFPSGFLSVRGIPVESFLPLKLLSRARAQNNDALWRGELNSLTRIVVLYIPANSHVPLNRSSG